MISINWSTYVIYVPKSYLTLVSGTSYELDVEQFRLDLIDIEDSALGIPHPNTHIHNTEFDVAGTTFARAVIIINPYSVEFEDGQYSVSLKGANNNIFDVSGGILVQNQVQLIANNSAGLVKVTSGSGLSTDQATQLLELYRLHALQSGTTLQITDTSRKVNDGSSDIIDQTVADDGTTTTVERV